MTNINLPQGSYNAADLIAAIQQSNDQQVQQASLQTESGNLLQAVLTRLAAVEAMLPLTRAGFGVITTVANGVTTYRVQTLDQNGNTQIITFALPV
jgi:hypothetical protein